MDFNKKELATNKETCQVHKETNASNVLVNDRQRIRFSETDGIIMN